MVMELTKPILFAAIIVNRVVRRPSVETSNQEALSYALKTHGA